MNRIILMIAAWMLAAVAVAQEATVKRVEMTPTDLSASKYVRTDNNGEPCALVRVEVIADNVEFFGNVIQPVEHKTGDYWVYMTGGTKMLQIKSPSFLPLMINFADYGIDALIPKMTYVITLSLPAAAAPQQQSATSGRNYLIMNISPANAKVTVDGAEREVRDGKVKTLLRHGTYTYHVEAPGYLPEDGQVTVGSDRAERTVTLRSTKGTLAVNTTTPSTEIYVNGERVGTGSWRGEMFPDTYAVEGRLAGHRNAEQLVTLTTGQTATITLPALTPILGSLNVDYEPIGASISIDGTTRGTTPAVFDNLLIGSHSVTIAADGFDPQTLTATVTEGQLTDLTGKLTAKEKVNYERFYQNGKYGFKNEKGNIVIPAKYDDAAYFSEGLARVKVNGKSGFIDKNNNMVIPAKYDDADFFSEGLAGVRINEKWGFIDENDNLVIPAKYDLINIFSEGLAEVNVNGKSGFIDKNNNLVIPVKYDNVHYFSEGLAVVEINEKWGFIDRNDNMVIPAKYDYADSFSEGLAGVRINEKWGFIDKNNNMVIPAKYDDAFNFSEGLATVYINGKTGFINKNDNFVIPAKYDRAKDFYEGLAAVEINEKWGFIDKNDNLVIPTKYDLVGYFSNGKVRVELNGRTFYIDKNGNELK